MDANIALTHFTSAAIVVYLMNKLKAASWFPLLQAGKTKLNTAFSAVIAFCVSIGIHTVWTANAAGGHTLSIEIPTLTVLGLGVWHWLNQFALQETIHQVVSGADAARTAASQAPAVAVKP